MQFTKVSPLTVRLSLVLAATAIVGVSYSALAQTTTPEQQLTNAVKNGPLQKIGPWLANLYQEYQQSNSKASFATKNPVLKVAGGKVGVDLYAIDPAALKSSLAAMGANVTSSSGPLMSAQVPVAALGDLAGLASLNFADAVLATTRVAASQGKVVSQGDAAMGADTARAASGMD